jgi:Holliday junction resolvasome RuvABC endonuclease subunit
MPSRKIPALIGLLTVDPGDHTGWALWDGTLRPMTGQITLSRSKDIVGQPAQLASMWERFHELIKEMEPRAVLIEAVEFWSGSVKSRAAASRQNLSKLAYLVGGYSNICAFHGIEWFLMPSRTWKGQMDDHAVAMRVARIIEAQYSSVHVTDAVGMGLHLAGLFNRGKIDKAM